MIKTRWKLSTLLCTGALLVNAGIAAAQTCRIPQRFPGADLGTWEIIIWAKDGNTSPTQNGYGFAAYYNAQPVQVD